MSDLTVRDSPVNPPADYAEVQDTAGVHKAQSSSFDEAEAGQKVRSHFTSSTHPKSFCKIVTHAIYIACTDAPVHGTNQKGAESVGWSVDYDAMDRAKREREVSNGQVDQRRGYRFEKRVDLV